MRGILSFGLLYLLPILFDKKSMTKSHALGIRIRCILLILEEIKNYPIEIKKKIYIYN